MEAQKLLRFELCNTVRLCNVNTALPVSGPMASTVPNQALATIDSVPSRPYNPVYRGANSSHISWAKNAFNADLLPY